MTDSNMLHSMRNTIPEPPALSAFRTLYLEFAKAMLELTNNKFVDAGEEKVLVQGYQFSGDDYSLMSRPCAAHEQYIPWPNDDAFPHAIAEKCADAFYSSGLASGIRLSDNAGTPIENPSLDAVRPFIIHMHLDRPIRHLVRKYGRTSFSRRQIRAYLDRYIAHWKGEADSEAEIAPIYNFETEIRTIKLDEHVTIVRFTGDEKTRVMRELGGLERTIDLRNYASAFQVARLRPLEGGLDEDRKREIRTHARKALQCAITSLRLMKPGAIGTMGYIHFKGPAGQLGASLSPLEDFHLPWPKLLLFRNRYVLERSDLTRFRKLYRNLSGDRFKTWNELELLLRQFNRSCQRDRDEDRILDYAICLERALLSGVRCELSYRLALRAAKLLRNLCSPKQTFAHMRCLYDVRSKIVHSNETLSSAGARKTIERVGLKPGGFMASMDTLMRLLLSTIIERVAHRHTLKLICKELDAEIIESL